MAWSGKKSLSINGFLCADPSRAVRKAVIYANPSRAAGKTGVFAEIVIAPEPAQERFRQTAGKERRESCMMLSCRDLDILRLLRWCRMIRSKELYEAFSKDEVMNLSAAQMIRFSDAVKAWYLTPCGNRVAYSPPRCRALGVTHLRADCGWRGSSQRRMPPVSTYF